jgi:peptidoglycan hydrolase-like protein with peptidoglycan-binding domain
MKYFPGFSRSLIIFLLIPVCCLAQTATRERTVERDRTAELKITSKEVSAVQAELSEQGYYKAKQNGILDQETRASLRRYQTEHELTASGRIDRPTLEKLGIEYPVTGKEKDRTRRQGVVPKVGSAVKDTASATGKAVGGTTKSVVEHGKAGVEKTVEVTSEAAKKIKR